MKLKHSLIILLLVVSLVSFYSCRNKVEEPSPLGPSTFSILMIASASPNVLIARNNGVRDTSNITVTLTTFQGTPLANETVIFDVYDMTFEKLLENYGYFEGNQSVVAKTTDSNGRVNVTYYGPVFDEIVYYWEESAPPTVERPFPYPPETVAIRASLAWQGKEMISEFAQIQVVSELHKEIRLQAAPNVLWITSGSQKSRQSTLTAKIADLKGAPVKGEKIWLDIETGPGEFKQNGQRRISGRTDENGEVVVTYLAPKREEIYTDGIKVKIQAQVQTSDPNWAHDEAEIRLNRGD
ncbi:MAG: Ig-like domain-containing protein [Candidatus Aminicenantaceae bacterium]